MSKEFTSKDAEKYLKKAQDNFSEKDLNKVLEKEQDIKNKFSSSGPLGRFIEDFKLLMSVLKDYSTGKYRKIPWWAIAAIGGALLYVFSPIDAIPDFIPIIGLIDDALVVAACLMLVEQELHRYKEWKTSQAS